jgi:hypothetical protein
VGARSHFKTTSRPAETVREESPMRAATRRLPVLSLLAAILASPLPSGAEIYRWVDAQGREHFTTNKSQVPAAYRNQVTTTEGGNLSRASSSSAGRSGAEAEQPGGDERFGGAPPAIAAEQETEEQYLGKGEEEWRREVESLRRRVEMLEPIAERCEGSEDVRISPASDSRAYEEEASEAEQCQRTRQDLDLHRGMLDSLEERARRAGVPPGWLR